jgi:hypothetical protein
MYPIKVEKEVEIIFSFMSFLGSLFQHEVHMHFDPYNLENSSFRILSSSFDDEGRMSIDSSTNFHSYFG